MFRFWNPEVRGSEQTKHARTVSDYPECGGPLSTPTFPAPDLASASALASALASASASVSAPTPVASGKRKRVLDDITTCLDGFPPAKRPSTAHYAGLPSPRSACADVDDMLAPDSAVSFDAGRVQDVIQSQFGLEILLKHDELRLINQELAKCQIALEQLRRCHLIPYPVQCPTPDQMLAVGSGQGPALQSPGRGVPRWAPPFGVVEGPYARHYAKWLIPDAVFDAMPHDGPGPAGAVRTKVGLSEGRSTRASDRPARGSSGQRLQALHGACAQPKDKQSPCILKRSDGQTVKLICVDCKRWDFSSTQGFINHCRIAHRKEYKSHEEAAVRCGEPVELDPTGGIVGDDSTSSTAAAGLVNPLASSMPSSDLSAYSSLLRRINDSLELYHAGKLPHVKAIPGVDEHVDPKAIPCLAPFAPCHETPYLSLLMQHKRRERPANVEELVADAKTLVNFDLLSPGEEFDECDMGNGMDGPGGSKKASSSAARTRVPMRAPVRAPAPPTPAAVPTQGRSSRGWAPTRLEMAPRQSPEREEVATPMYHDMMDVDVDVDLSPSTLAGNTAPSLVSDDGEYDSDDGSASEVPGDLEHSPMSDMADISIEDMDVQDVTQPVTHQPVAKARRDDGRHVTFVTPLATGQAKGRRKHAA